MIDMIIIPQCTISGKRNTDSGMQRNLSWRQSGHILLTVFCCFALAEMATSEQNTPKGEFPDLTPYLNRRLKDWPPEMLPYWKQAVQFSVKAARPDYDNTMKTRSATESMKREYPPQSLLPWAAALPNPAEFDFLLEYFNLLLLNFPRKRQWCKSRIFRIFSTISYAASVPAQNAFSYFVQFTFADQQWLYENFMRTKGLRSKTKTSVGRPPIRERKTARAAAFSVLIIGTTAQACKCQVTIRIRVDWNTAWDREIDWLTPFDASLINMDRSKMRSADLFDLSDASLINDVSRSILLSQAVVSKSALILCWKKKTHSAKYTDMRHATRSPLRPECMTMNVWRPATIDDFVKDGGSLSCRSWSFAGVIGV